MLPYSTKGFERVEEVIDGVRTVVYVAGSGNDVVYLHGGGTFHGFEFARDWLAQFRVWLPYHPGFGESADALTLKTLQDYDRHYRALFDKLGLERTHLVGASLGGRLAADFAIAFPDRVRSLVLVAPAGIVLPEFPQPDFPSIAHHDWPHYFSHDPYFVRPFWPSEPNADFLAARARESRTVGQLLADAGAHAEEFRRSLPGMRVRTLIIWGREDRMVPAGNAAAWQASIANSKVEIIERAGHLLLDESPAARAAVAQFMSRGDDDGTSAGRQQR